MKKDGIQTRKRKPKSTNSVTHQVPTVQVSRGMMGNRHHMSKFFF